MRTIFGAVCLLIVLNACSSDSSGSSTTDNYDRTALLTHWADDIIVPAFENFQQKTNAQAEAALNFSNNPTQENLQILRTSWFEAYKALQSVTMYDIGQADASSFKEAVNTFPADAAGIESNVASGTYNLAPLSSYPRQGFPGLDYMINGLGSDDTEILSHYTGTDAAKYKQYLNDICTRIKTLTDAIVNDWNNGYRDTYVASNGYSVSSSVNKTTNLFTRNLEKDIRSGKIGIPAGLLSNNVPFPDKVEAYYKNDISRELYLISLKAQQDFFNGKAFGSQTNGLGLASYLDAVNAQRDGQQLSDIINAKFDAAYTAGSGLNVSFSQQIVSDNNTFIAAYDALQEVVVVTKLDLLQALNITIDYVDGDGD
ncbi:imelysin family protein [Flavobacterium silvaticum]|uniref:Imelysin family protein n=1 Tax=Flavobacterium silvaticum TaxID=1852020 RepID=A0A972FU62_9FLAO|nr:imelysin family protein [Flavobacterium silvaticum]NMH28087.1 imelysin family protein [Flavobacterium silvaticum]